MRPTIRTQCLILLIGSSLIIQSCKPDYTPKPHGYPKVSYPERHYQSFSQNAPFTFQFPDYAEVQHDTSANAEKYWYNLYFPVFDGTVYLSYKPVHNNLDKFIEDARILAYKHSIKADAIEESIINRHEQNVYGILYDLQGNTASSLQFFITDSMNHFLRGSLYLNTPPAKDSLAPVIAYLREDVIHLLGSLQWQNPK